MKWFLLVVVFVMSGGVYWFTTSTSAPVIDDGAEKKDDSKEYTIDPADFLNNSLTVATTSDVTLSSNEVIGLLRMREEEKLARDVYEALGTKWGVPLFSNIARSEQTHTNAVQKLLALYGIQDPVGVDIRGEFQDANLQELYNNLVAQGYESLDKALAVGATVEDLDIFDLERLMQETKNEQILTVYRNLQKGSRNHLRAFHDQLERRTITYTPQYISEATFSSIINSSQERGRM